MSEKYLQKVIVATTLTITLLIPISTLAISEVLTGKAENVKQTEAVLNGSVNPNGEKTVGYFRYSTETIPPVFCNDIYGSLMKSTYEVDLGSVSTPVTFSTKIVNLEPDTKYYFCAVGSNTDQINTNNYGGVQYFITLGPPGLVSVTTDGALVENSTSAFINGSYVSGDPSNTWFEYRKTDPGNITQWIKVGQESHVTGDSGKLTYELTQLTPGTNYEFKAAIVSTVFAQKNTTNFFARLFGIQKAFAAKSTEAPAVKYGDTLTFKTQDADNIKPGPVGGGVGYKNPCVNPADVGCNGINDTDPIDGGGSMLPDLTAGVATPAFGKVNTPIVLMSLIRNQGKTPTPTSFYNFFQISLVKPTTSSTGNTLPGNSSFNNLFHAQTAFAATNSTGTDPNIINLPATSMPALSAGATAVTTQTYTFQTIGTYYIRTCADKNAPYNLGTIAESNEDNNCGVWASLAISQDGVIWGGGGGNGGGGNGGGSGTGTGTTPPVVIGQTKTPPVDDVVRYHEGIETVLQRQIVADPQIAKMYGYVDGTDLQSFSWYLADLFARIFGYVSSTGKEIRVIVPDMAAYEIDISSGTLTIYEYFDSKIVNIQKMTPSLRSIYEYEYYFRK